MENTTAYFKRIKITFECKDYFFTEEELSELSMDYWHFEGDPSSWLCASTYQKALEKCKDVPAPEPLAMELAAKTLGITEEKLQSSLDWNRHYLDWHG